ncbi:MAG: hypothetical protein ACOCXT_02425 [Candidatus Dojkabacteria bacterium]
MSTTQSAPQKPQVIVKKVTKVKKKRSITTLLASAVLLLTIFLIIGAIVAAGVWLHTFRVFTQETVAAEITVSEKTIVNDQPTFTVTYKPVNDVSGFWAIFGSEASSADEEVVVEMTGDQFFVDADMIRWKDWVTLANVKPVYKIYRLKSDFRDPEDEDRFERTIKSLNGGSDEFATRLQDNPDSYDWIAQSVNISSAGVNVQNNEITYQLKVTEDALVLEKK